MNRFQCSDELCDRCDRVEILPCGRTSPRFQCSDELCDRCDRSSREMAPKSPSCFSALTRGKDSGYAFRNHLVTRSEPAYFSTCQIVIGF